MVLCSCAHFWRSNFDGTMADQIQKVFQIKIKTASQHSPMTTRMPDVIRFSPNAVVKPQRVFYHTHTHTPRDDDSNFNTKWVNLAQRVQNSVLCDGGTARFGINTVSCCPLFTSDNRNYVATAVFQRFSFFIAWVVLLASLFCFSKEMWEPHPVTSKFHPARLTRSLRSTFWKVLAYVDILSVWCEWWTCEFWAPPPWNNTHFMMYAHHLLPTPEHIRTQNPLNRSKKTQNSNPSQKSRRHTYSPSYFRARDVPKTPETKNQS